MQGDEDLSQILISLHVKFSRKESLELDPIVINDKQIDIVSHAKILGVNCLKPLKLNHHIAEIVKKAGKRLFCLSRAIPFSGVSCVFIIIIYYYYYYYYCYNH